MTTFHSRSALKDVLAQADARAVVEEIAPEVLVSSLATGGDPFPLGAILGVILEPSDPRVEELLQRLTQIEDLTPRRPEAPADRARRRLRECGHRACERSWSSSRPEPSRTGCWKSPSPDRRTATPSLTSN